MRPSTTNVVLAIALAVGLLTVAVAPATATSDPYEFSEDVFYSEQGEVATITLETSDDTNGTLDVHIGTPAQGLLVHTTVVDKDGDGTVTLELNTSTAGQTDPESYLSVAGDDSISNVSQSTYYLSNLLNAGDYSLRTGAVDDPNDTATLVIEENDSAIDPISATPEPRMPKTIEFVESLSIAEPGFDDTATIPITFDSNGTATLRLSSNEVSSNDTRYNTTIELVDDNGDRRATVVIDLTASANETPDEYISVADEDRIEDISWNTSATMIKADTEYDLSLSDGNETVDYGTLIIEAKAPPDVTGTNASFADSIVHASLSTNSVANITIEFGPNSERATFTIGSESADFYSTGQLIDTDGDGQVVLLLNVTAPYKSTDFISVSEGDSLGPLSMDRPRNFSKSEYNLELTAGGNVTDVGTLMVSESATTASTTTATETTTEPTAESTPTTASDIPGFGVAVAVVALAALALAAIRR